MGIKRLETYPDENFGHPFQPYEIQVDLMREIYSCIENGCKVGIFESPTGTGKTLSLICSTMTWLRDFKRDAITSGYPDVNSAQPVSSESFLLGSDSESDDEPAWVKKAHHESVLNRASSAARDYELHLDTIEKNRKEKKQNIHKLEKKRKVFSSLVKANEIDEEVFVPDDYFSDSEQLSIDNHYLVSSQVKNLLAKVNDQKETAELINNCPTNIYFSSRTHSQLNQFSHQLKLTQFESSFVNLSERTKFLPMASRKQLCINPKVKKLNDITSINDACIDMQKTKISAIANSGCCEFYPKPNESAAVVKEFVDTAFTEIHDIEDLVLIGEGLKLCPYYSVRSGVLLTEIIALPYQMLLQESSRESLNLQIDNSIIIIDEAHNLFDVITSMNSVSINSNELSIIISSLQKYFKKFARRFNTGNRINIMKLIKICQVIKTFIENETNSGRVTTGQEILIHDIFEGTTADLVNIHKLEKYLSKSKIAYKIEGWVQQQLEAQGLKTENKSLSLPLLFKIAAFLKSLTNTSQEGKFFWDQLNTTTSIKYMLLDPSHIFKEMVTRAKCIILCGGTMEPMADYTKYLFPYIPENQIRKFSCNHVIPDSNLSVFPIGNSSKGNRFEFSFDKRNNPILINQLGQSIIKICGTVPDGVVSFFPSYKYLELVLEMWKKDSTYASLSEIKEIILEPKDSSQVDRVLANYSKAIHHSSGGALMLAVVGGKLSEGINFSDELARAVIMIGLPFPNAFSGELIARRQYIESSTLNLGGTSTMAKTAAREFYENICMRAVNQSIGRSIRHINDYSTLFLIDARYGNNNIQLKLSGWVRNRLETNKDGSCMEFDSAINMTKTFFDNKLKPN